MAASSNDSQRRRGPRRPKAVPTRAPYAAALAEPISPDTLPDPPPKPSSVWRVYEPAGSGDLDVALCLEVRTRNDAERGPSMHQARASKPDRAVRPHSWPLIDSGAAKPRDSRGACHSGHAPGLRGLDPSSRPVGILRSQPRWCSALQQVGQQTDLCCPTSATWRAARKQRAEVFHVKRGAGPKRTRDGKSIWQRPTTQQPESAAWSADQPQIEGTCRMPPTVAAKRFRPEGERWATRTGLEKPRTGRDGPSLTGGHILGCAAGASEAASGAVWRTQR